MNKQPKTMAPHDLVFQLTGTCNSYPWGKVGRSSLAARLCAQTPPGPESESDKFAIDDDTPYSEMWFGDYPDFPARRHDTGEALGDVLARHGETLLGRRVVEEFGGQLPFLPKILSIAKALPLQIHPDKSLAQKLHAKNPSSFTDPNHKPEIALALGTFEVFAGFKPLAQIEPVFQQVSVLRQFVPSPQQQQEGGKAAAKWTDATLREVTRSLLKADPETVSRVQTELSRVPREHLGDAGYILDLLPRLQGQYGPSDAGSLVALLCMNYLVFEAGDAIYIPADGIHAYLAGDIVECMARSNNVLNAGFCARADRDNADLFADALTFRSAHSRENVVLAPAKSARSASGKTTVYSPPMREFDMLKTDLGAGGEREQIAAGDGPGVLIVTQGAGSLHADGWDFELREGFIYYVAPGVALEFTSSSSTGTDGLQIHMAVV